MIRTSGSSIGSVTDYEISVASGPGSPAQIAIDSTLYLPESTPAPAVLLAHGFGGSKSSVDEQARELAESGFAVLAFSARGFGKSGGSIGINDPDREVADARALVNWLAERPEVEKDSATDPRIGVAGASYGGALALMLAGTDSRIDAVVATGTWNDLGEALFPNYAEPAADSAETALTASNYTWPGVLKRSWAGVFFGAGSLPNEESGPQPMVSAASVCGRFDATLCPQIVSASVSGEPSTELLSTLSRHSPASVAANITAPTLLLQGQRDTLFGLDQADATARAVRGPVQVRWFNGGHDGGWERSEGPARQFLLSELTDAEDEMDPEDRTAFRFDLPGAMDSEGNQRIRSMRAIGYPGAGSDIPVDRAEFELSGRPAQQIIRPPGAVPAAVSSIPGFSVGGASLPVSLGTLGLDLPGQTAVFSTKPVSEPLSIVGSPTVDLRVTANAEAGTVVLFVKLYDVSSGGRRALPGGGVAAIRIPDDMLGQPLRITLPAIAHQVPAGNHLEVAIATTDAAYATPLTPAVLTVASEGGLIVPSVAAVPRSRDIPLVPIVGTIAILGAFVLLGAYSMFRRRPAVTADGPDDTPLQVSGLVKDYSNGYRAVDGVSFTAERGTILGLLGPNGAGKTTTLRMTMGLIRPDAGEVRIFGSRVTAGAPVLARIGAFVEGPGLLPHLSGADNLRLYWASTGRPAEDSHLEEVLEIAALGTAIDRPVRSYSHGMKQRLAIAQAMLGLPDLLILDEPTNGLDPPQIRTVRDVLTNYVKPGRTVVVSSHLLAEVEQTCTHAVVMNLGKVIASGLVADLVAAAGPIEIRVDDIPAAVTALNGVSGLGRVIELDGASPRVRVDAGSVGVPDLVRALTDSGVAIHGINGSTRLEDVFLALVHDPRSAVADEATP